jgi:His-Xaa-Ser system protein HxsD
MAETISNMEIENDSVLLSINPKIYPLEAIYSAAYVFLDKVYIMLDGDPESEVIVELKPKNKQNSREELEALGREFNNELINYSDYQKRSERTARVRELIMQRALLTNAQIAGEQDYDADASLNGTVSEDDSDFLEDPEGIAIPWEEKYGKSASGTEE